MFEQAQEKGFVIRTLHHAEAILRIDMPAAVEELEQVLLGLEIPVEELVRGGGGEGLVTQRLRHSLSDIEWQKHNFQIRKIVDGIEKESISHEIDHVKRFVNGTCALEIEWNTKDTFYDRDLDNFKRLHADGVVSLGCIITRGESLQNALVPAIQQFALANAIDDLAKLDAYYEPTKRQKEAIRRSVARYDSFAEGWARCFVADKFGMATTHWAKLCERIDRGLGNPCPLVLIGIPDTVLAL